MQITRTEVPTGGPNRTRREEIIPLNTGSREVEPEQYWDESESEGWDWETDPSQNTWRIQLAASKSFIEPFEQLDSQAAAEQATGEHEKGGVYTYPFSSRFQPIGEGLDDGDLNSDNWEEKTAAHFAKYFRGGLPVGGTEIMAAVQAADKHFLGEFGAKPLSERPVRARVVWTDGQLHDADKFRAYLSAATPHDGYGAHKDWDEVWAIAIIGEGQTSLGNPGKDAADQYRLIAKDHPWIHVYYFEKVVNPAEIAEDMALAVVPTQA